MKKKQSKWILKKREFECVGMKFHVTLSTRRFMKHRIKEKPMLVEFKREHDNPHDENAIAVYGGNESDNPYRKMHIGYLSRQVAEVLAPAIDEGRAELGTSFMTDLDVDKGIAELQVKLRVLRG